MAPVKRTKLGKSLPLLQKPSKKVKEEEDLDDSQKLSKSLESNLQFVPKIHPLLIPHLLDSIFSLLPLSTQKSCRLVCNEWNDTCSKFILRNSCCSIIPLTPTLAPAFLSTFSIKSKSSPPLSSSYIFTDISINQFNAFDSLLLKFGASIKSLTIKASLHPHSTRGQLTIPRLLKLLFQDCPSLEQLTLYIDIEEGTITLKESFRLVSQMIDTSAPLSARVLPILNSSNFKQFHLNHSPLIDLKSFRTLRYFPKEPLYSNFSVDLFSQAFLSLQTLDLSTSGYSNTPLMNPERSYEEFRNIDKLALDALWNSSRRLSSTLKNLKLGSANASVLKKLIENGFSLKRFDVWRSHRIKSEEWTHFLQTQSSTLESLRIGYIVDFQGLEYLSSEPLFLTFPSSTMSHLNELILVHNCDRLGRMDFSQLSPNLQTLSLSFLPTWISGIPTSSLYNIPIHRGISPKGIQINQITCLKLLRTYDPLSLHVISKSFPCLKGFRVAVSSVNDVGYILDNFRQLEHLDLTLKLRDKYVERKPIMMTGSDLEEWKVWDEIGQLIRVNEEPNDVVHYGEILAIFLTTGISKNDTKNDQNIVNLANLKDLNSFKFSVLHIHSKMMSKHNQDKYVRMELCDTPWYLGLISLKKLKYLRLVNVDLSKACQQRILRDSSSIHKLQVLSPEQYYASIIETDEILQ